MTDHELASVTANAADVGASVAMRSFRSVHSIEHKSGKTDVVTQADRDAQMAVCERIQDRFPDDLVIGEEGDGPTDIPDIGRAWIVDPIDGTNNYVRGNRVWATSVACLIDGEPIAAATILPATGDCYIGTPDGVTRNGVPVEVSERDDPETFAVAPSLWWDFEHRDEFAAITAAIVHRFGDMRRIGSAQATLAGVASGELDAALTNIHARPWDTVAGAAMVEWAGGTATDLAGDRWRPDRRGPVVSNGRIHDVVRATARAADAVD